ncbi:MAG TPA: hypothetical protein VGC39_10065, partial [Candidatus Methylacidiphilales bacterium]
LKIELYNLGKVSTTITSPKADLYLAERRMRTKNTVLVERDDMEATAQTCDFDQTNKKYLLRENVKVVLKNFDAGIKPLSASSSSPAPPSGSAPAVDNAAGATPSLPLRTAPPNPARNDSVLDIPGAYANTNVMPTTPTPPRTVTP